MNKGFFSISKIQSKQKAGHISHCGSCGLYKHCKSPKMQPSGKFKIKGQGTSGWFTEIRKSKYSGEPLQFSMPAKILLDIERQYNDCTLSSNRLKVTGKHFAYVTVLGVVEEKE